MTTQHLWAIVLAAGQGTRLAQAGMKEKKQFLSYQGVPLFWHSVRTFSHIPPLAGIILVFPEQECADTENMVKELRDRESIGVPILCTQGGERRQALMDQKIEDKKHDQYGGDGGDEEKGLDWFPVFSIISQQTGAASFPHVRLPTPSNRSMQTVSYAPWTDLFSLQSRPPSSFPGTSLWMPTCRLTSRDGL